MSQKRHQEDGKLRADDCCSSEEKRRRVPPFKNVVLEVMKMQSVQNLLEPILEPLIRRVVKEEVESALRKHTAFVRRNCGTEIHPTEIKRLQLQFLNNVSLPVFTGTRIEGENSSSLKIALVDAITGKIIDSGPQASAKVEIIVLEGDFDCDERDDWTQEEFRGYIVREREGKKPLLAGDVTLNLKDGIGLVGEISLTDNSSWTRSRKFRLAARIVDNVDGIRTREAKTESFIVRDHRGELYKKHHPPSLLDEVWRLEKIGKDGAFHKRLNQENIKTVKDFLTLLFIDATRLRNILGTGMSAKMWEVTLEHARTCQLDKRLYLYWSPGTQQKTGLVFNVVGQVLGVLLEDHYVPVEKLSEGEKVDAHNLLISAFHHWDDVFSFDEETSLANGLLQLPNSTYPSSSAQTEGFDYKRPVVSTDILSSLYTAGSISSLVDDYPLHNMDNIGLRFDQSLNFPGELSNSLTQAFYDDDHLRFFDIDNSHQPHSQDFGSPSDVCNVVYTRPGDKAQSRWTKISSVLKWFTVRKKVALRKTQVPETRKYS